MGWWIGDALSAPTRGAVWVVAWLVWVVVSITLLELAHGWAALKLGDTTPRDLDRMMFNPLVHMGPVSLVMLVIIGIAWGQMPVDTSRLRGRYAESLVALAGPAMNLLLMLVSGVGAVLWLGLAGNVDEPLRTNMAMFLVLGPVLNLILAVFNLAPIPPLDGSRVVANFFPAYGRFFDTENGRWAGLGLFLLYFFLLARPLMFYCLLFSVLAVAILGDRLASVTGMGVPIDEVLKAF